MREPCAVFAIESRLVGLQLVLLETMAAEATQDATTSLGGHAQPVEDDVLILFIGDAESSFEPHHIGLLPQQRETEPGNSPPPPPPRPLAPQPPLSNTPDLPH